jgi:hypothetical protein
MKKAILNESNYPILFYKAYNLLMSMYNAYPVIQSSFSNNIQDTITCFKHNGSKNNKLSKILFKNYFSFLIVPENDVANRQILFGLADTYFLTGVWYNIFSLVNSYNNSNSKLIGKANNNLADYTKQLIYTYTLGIDSNKSDKRDIGSEICMSWLSYEELVIDSLNLVKDEIITYRKLVNIALTVKLGINALYITKEK